MFQSYVAVKQFRIHFLFCRPSPLFFYPTLHHIKVELEDGHVTSGGTIPSGTRTRFEFDERSFPGYSWRGYAVMSNLQVCLSISTKFINFIFSLQYQYKLYLSV